MFGLIHGLFVLLGSGYESLRRYRETSLGEKRGIERRLRGENDKNIYFDWQGNERDLTTGKKVMFYFDENHHYVEKEVGGPVIRDLTQEHKDGQIEYELRKGKKFIMLHNNRELERMWIKRFRNKYGDSGMPDEGNVNVYIYGYNNRLCIDAGDRDLYREYKKAAEKMTGYKNIGINGSIMFDLKTGKVIDIDDSLYKSKSKMYYYEKINEPIEISEEEEKKIIDYWNEQIDKGLLTRVKTKWAALF